MAKHVLQMRRLELKIAPLGAAANGEGYAVRGEVRHEPLNAGKELQVRPAQLLLCGALREVVVDREGDVGEVGE